MQSISLLARYFRNHENFRLSPLLLLVASLVVLAGCGSQVASSGTATGTPATTVTTSAPTMTLALTNAGAMVSSISNGAPGTLTATLKNSTGAVVPNTVVTFSTDATLATIAPSATALTNGSGVAAVTLSPATSLAAGATTITATAQVGSEVARGSIGFSVGTATVTVTSPMLGVGAAPLSAYGTTSITVTVAVGGVPVTTPQNVTFSSICAVLGKAVLSTGTVTATGGLAIGSYRDNGCAGTDVITASVAGVTSAPTNLIVSPPATGSIQFVSATPSSLSLKGIGGTEASQVSFKVLDGSGKPLSGKTVTFGLSTTVGGIALAPSVSGIATAVSDANGLVTINVNSGIISTPVRVTASVVDTSTVPAITVTSQSSALTISTGIADQDSFSVSATKLNPEFWDWDGNTTVLTARLADHFNNPVPDGTVVNFTAEGGSIVSSCNTIGGACSSTLTGQAPRPSDGRVSVLAYAVGEESFIDLNGNGVADLVPNEMVDINGKSTDMPEAWRDDNENGVFDAGIETFIDFNQNGRYDGPEGQYNGVLCSSSTSSPSTCSPNRSIHVRKNLVIVFSGSKAFISKNPLPSPCNAANQPVDFLIVDVNGNPMPAGTTIDLTINSGAIAGEDLGRLRLTQDNTNLKPVGKSHTIYVVDGCSGNVTVTVTTPGGSVTPPQAFPVSP